MNTIIIIINDLINICNIEYLYVILFEILCLDSKYRIDLINIKYDNYIENYFSNNRMIPNEGLYKNEDFKILESDHHILNDKSIKKEFIREEKFTFSEETYEKKHKDFIKFNRNDRFLTTIYSLLNNEKKDNNNSEEEIDN
jgi:hypothetical protein